MGAWLPFRYNRVEPWDEMVPFELAVGQKVVAGLISGAEVVLQGKPASSVTTLLDLDDYRIKIRRTQHEPVAVEEVREFAASRVTQMLHAAAEPEPPLTGAVAARSPDRPVAGSRGNR